MHSWTRRQFLDLSARTAAAAAFTGIAARSSAVEPFHRAGSARLQLSLAAYSFRDFFKDSNHGRKGAPDSARQIDMLQFIDYCAEHGCDGAELTSYYFPRELNDAYLIQVRRHAFLRGVAISGTAVGNDFTVQEGKKRAEEIAATRQWIDRAALLGAPHIRVFAGSGKGLSDSDARKICISALEECADYAGQRGIFLGLENHGGIVAEADGLLEIVRAVKSKWLGVNLDTGNFHTEDPYGDLAKCAPYAVNVQYKTEIKPKNGVSAESDLGRVVKILTEANYQGYVALEYEASEDPWKAVPRALSAMKKSFAQV